MIGRTIRITALVDSCPSASGNDPAWRYFHDRIGDASLIEYAHVLADELIDRAVVDAAGHTSWPLRGQRKRRNLTGLSHGAAGVATNC